MEEKTSKDKRSIEEVEIDALDLLEGKMNDAAINRLHKQIVSTSEQSSECSDTSSLNDEID